MQTRNRYEIVPVSPTGASHRHLEQRLRTLQVRLLGIMAISFCNVIALVLPTAADPGDKAGWSVHIDPRKRAFLIYVPVADGSRVLTIGCLRDVDNFTVISSGLRIGANNETKATLAVSNGTARYAVDGEVEPDQATGMQAFNTDIDADAKALRQISGALLPVLEGKGPIALTVGSAEFTLPTTGLTQPLSRFKAICFGSR